MAKTARRILKGDNVRLGGQFHLDVAQAEAAKGVPKQQDPASAAPQVRIVENHPEFAVIEVICSCGAGTYLRCEYAGTGTPAEDSQT